MTHPANTTQGPAAPADPRPFLNTAVALAGRTLAAVPHALPAEPRGGPVPFAAVVDVAPKAPDIDRLVAWSGRTP
ncbi:hypothetical protein [Streptomyces candidus]|uniref:Uncharacterized protein n=1 Tax=Streptomyces candidus TaxID=67283 RepID=A0A7X0HKH5_9ACTN|nr:hypothetical protein [Streptomyces candidus]MBB6439341.1 hypothetical protein [Streptomyces candidus]GHH42291.1 hypothetical protein GCM10018773_26450 [Streptomyces candidus]